MSAKTNAIKPLAAKILYRSEQRKVGARTWCEGGDVVP